MRIFTDYDSFPKQEARATPPDLLETSSNYLMKTWSIAFGPKQTTIGKVADIAKRSIAFIAGLLLLPLTLSGLVFRACSKSHQITYHTYNSPKTESKTPLKHVPTDLFQPMGTSTPRQETTRRVGRRLFQPISASTPNDNIKRTPSPITSDDEEFETPNTSPFPLTISQITLLREVADFTAEYEQGKSLTAMVQRILCPFNVELPATTNIEDSKLTISMHTTQDPLAKIKSPTSRLPYNFHLKPQNNRYTFTICKQTDCLILDLNSALHLEKVDLQRQTEIINSYNSTIKLAAWTAGINLADDTQTNLERSSKLIIVEKFIFLPKTIKAITAPFSENDAQNQKLMHKDLADKIKKNENITRKCARSAIAFGEMLIADTSLGLQDGGDTQSILKLFNPAGSAEGTGRDAGRVVWFENGNKLQREPF